MSTTQPIRNKSQLEKFKNYYKKTEKNFRNYTLIILGLNTALRINDLLHLTCEMVYANKKVREHIIVRERKTGKENRIYLNKEARTVLKEYYSYLQMIPEHTANPYLFPSPIKQDQPLSRYQAYRIIHKAAMLTDLTEYEHISCHSLRKTFGYFAWKQKKDPILIMHIYNHSSFTVTKRYLCIEQDEKDRLYQEIKI